MVERTRRSSRGSDRGSERSSRGSASGRRSSFRGEDGRRKAEEELERQKAKADMRKQQGNQPFRFRVTVGEEREGVILDESPDFFRYEHNMKDNNGKWSVFTGCVKEWDNCPACAALDRESYYALYLSILDLTPFETRDGEEVEFSRKLLVVKPQQQKKFIRFHDKEGSMRGAIFRFTRDGDKDSAIGNDIEFTGEWMDEDELAEYVREWKDREGKTHTEECGEPYNYDELFEEPDTEQLRALVGGAPAAGSRREEDRELGRRERRRGSRDSDDRDNDNNGDRPERSSRRGRDRSATRDAEDWKDPDSPPWNESEGGDADGGTNGEPEQAPERGSRRRRGEPSPEPEGRERGGRATRRSREGRDPEPPARESSPRRVQPRRSAR